VAFRQLLYFSFATQAMDEDALNELLDEARSYSNWSMGFRVCTAADLQKQNGYFNTPIADDSSPSEIDDRIVFSLMQHFYNSEFDGNLRG